MTDTMRISAAAALTAAILATLGGCGPVKNAAPEAPPAFAGTYTESCRNITTLTGGYISAECADPHGAFHANVIQAGACKGDIGNQNGVLICNGAAVLPPGAPVPGKAPVTPQGMAPPGAH